MAKSPPPTHQSSKPARSAAPARFNLGGENLDVESEDEYDGDVTGILKEHQARQAKKNSARTTEYQVQKKAIYAAARKNAQDISNSGVTYIEDARIKMQQLKNQEVAHDKVFGDFQHLCEVQEETIQSLLSVYPPMFEELGRQRSNQVAASSEMLSKHLVRRRVALKQFSKNARAHVEEARENERRATDASALIKHYKNLLNA